MSVEEAFDRIADKAIEGEYWYVCLYQSYSYYGGPEEGGWWGHDNELIRYQKYPTKEAAERAKLRIDKLSKVATKQACSDWGKQCLEELESAYARGLEAEDLPETNGPDEFFVTLERSPGKCESRGSRTYE